MIVPQGLKRPGEMLVAPRNAAAKAGSRKLRPDRGSADPVAPTYMTPAAGLVLPAGGARAPPRRDKAEKTDAVDPDAPETSHLTASAHKQQPSAERRVVEKI